MTISPIRKSIFIDGSFLFHHAQSIKIRIDYVGLLSVLVNSGDYLVAATYFTALPSASEMEDKHRNFLRILRRGVRIQVKSVPLLRHHGGSGNGNYSKGEDILLACNMVRGALLDQYDEAVLVSGDGDFVPAVEMVQNAGKRVTVAAFKSSLSTTLEGEANDVLYLDSYLNRIRLSESNASST